MLAVKHAKNVAEMLEAIEGTTINSGSVGTNTNGSPNFSDLTAGAFTGVVAGDSVYISGIATPFVVLTHTDDNHLIMTTTISPAHTTNAKWKVKRGGVGASNLALGSPMQDNLSGQWHIIYTATTFGV